MDAAGARIVRLAGGRGDGVISNDAVAARVPSHPGQLVVLTASTGTEVRTSWPNSGLTPVKAAARIRRPGGTRWRAHAPSAPSSQKWLSTGLRSQSIFEAYGRDLERPPLTRVVHRRGWTWCIR